MFLPVTVKACFFGYLQGILIEYILYIICVVFFSSRSQILKHILYTEDLVKIEISGTSFSEGSSELF